jgi:hypothetical protein
MLMSAVARSAAFGFLTAVEHDDFGICGGYLVLSAAGRPVEFHCTAPVKASRAQEILYGPTLREYLYEQIAPALLGKAKAAPTLVFTDLPRMLAAACVCETPLLLVLAGSPDEAGGQGQIFALGKNRMAASGGAEQADIEERWRRIGADQFDLLEPFVRIREALEEAQRAAASKAA